MPGLVAFAFGTQPSLAAGDAITVAERLSHRRTVAAATAARKIKTEAARDSMPDQPSRGIELTRPEMLALRAVLAEYAGTPAADTIAQLRRELEQTI